MSKCPNCGHCKECGRSDFHTWPTYPYPYQQPYPYWSTVPPNTGGGWTTTITSSGTNFQ
jgi:hypothetical protein